MSQQKKHNTKHIKEQHKQYAVLTKHTTLRNKHTTKNTILKHAIRKHHNTKNKHDETKQYQNRDYDKHNRN